jgi:hypothetical protein
LYFYALPGFKSSHNSSLGLKLIPAIWLALLTSCWQLAVAQRRDEGKEVTIPLDHFYVERLPPGFLRKTLSRLTFGFSTGYGSTALKHNLSGWVVYQPSAGDPVLYNAANPSLAYTNWFNRITSTPLTINPSDFQVNADTARIGFRSASLHLPLQLTIHVQVKDQYRVGAGYAFEYTRLGVFKPISFADNLGSFDPGFSGFFLKKYFIMGGVTFYRYDNYLLSAEIQAGGFSMGNKFDQASISRSMLLNLGLPVERELSEYLRVFVRPSFELRNFTLNVSESGRSVRHRFNAFYIHIGANYRLPELPKCFIRECRVQINHAHGNREYRSRVHPIWQKQNPHYGENYPTLFKYKGKNRKKLNPY